MRPLLHLQQLRVRGELLAVGGVEFLVLFEGIEKIQIEHFRRAGDPLQTQPVNIHLSAIVAANDGGLEACVGAGPARL